MKQDPRGYHFTEPSNSLLLRPEQTKLEEPCQQLTPKKKFIISFDNKQIKIQSNSDASDPIPQEEIHSEEPPQDQRATRFCVRYYREQFCEYHPDQKTDCICKSCIRRPETT